ncbi:MAG: hypothetical protein WBF16_10025, partial [Candidatus Deferrimicrobiaceae bacterium]
MRKYWALFLSLVFAASFGFVACAKKEAPPPPPPPAEAPADKGAMAPAEADKAMEAGKEAMEEGKQSMEEGKKA